MHWCAISIFGQVLVPFTCRRDVALLGTLAVVSAVFLPLDGSYPAVCLATQMNLASLMCMPVPCRDVALPGTLAVVAAFFLRLDAFGGFHWDYSDVSRGIIGIAPLCFVCEHHPVQPVTCDPIATCA